MAQFDFLGSWDDSWRIMASILGINHIRVIPNLKFDRAEPTFISILDEGAKALLLQWRFVCLFSTKFSRFPPEMHRIEGGVNSGKYSVDLAAGGPGLGLSLPACYEKDGRWNLACGMLYYARNTLNRETGLWEKPTPELVAGYKKSRELYAAILLVVTILPKACRLDAMRFGSYKRARRTSRAWTIRAASAKCAIRRVTANGVGSLCY